MFALHFELVVPQTGRLIIAGPLRHYQAGQRFGHSPCRNATIAPLMLRKTLAILSLIGLLLSVGLWGVSYFGLDIWRLQGGAGSEFRDNIHIFIADGVASCQRSRVSVPRIKSTTWWRFNLPPLDGGYNQGLRWWRPIRTVSSPVGGLRLVQVWLWLPVVLSACPCFILLCVPRLHRRRKRRKLGLCLKCGYDVRASRDRCPECGTTIER